MNKYKESLKVSEDIKEAIKSVEEIYRSQARVMSKEDKERLESYLRRVSEKNKREEK